MEVFIPTTFCACLKPVSVIAMKIFRSLNCDAYVIYVAQSLVFYVVFVCVIVLSFCRCSNDHCPVYSIVHVLLLLTTLVS